MILLDEVNDISYFYRINGRRLVIFREQNPILEASARSTGLKVHSRTNFSMPFSLWPRVSNLIESL